MRYDLTNFIQGSKELGIELSDEQIGKFIKYYELLIEKNKVMNLTAITEFDEVVYKHFLDSLAIAKVYNLTGVNNLIDVGTGAGFPGIPIKIAFENIYVVLLDSLNKRIDFLGQVVDELKLEEVECVHGRAEDFARLEDFREEFDLVVSRAVANLRVLLEYDVPFVKIGGVFVSYKSADIDSEIEEAKNAMAELGVGLDRNEITIPGTNLKRSFLVFEKKVKTPDKYPRKAGLVQKKPL